jgi:FKBP-type peptidyl-prolyl cis-trans isomerase SlyD
MQLDNHTIMKIANNTVASFHYRLYDEDQQLLEESYDGDPNLYLHGHDNIMPGLEKEMLGKQAGDQFTCTLPPHLAYGLREDNKVQRVPLKYLKHEKKLKPGKIVRINSDQGMKTATVIKLGKFNADVDFNHPLCGKTIRFEIEVIDVRAASQDEIDHKHAHGVGGHQH